MQLALRLPLREVALHDVNDGRHQARHLGWGQRGAKQLALRAEKQGAGTGEMAGRVWTSQAGWRGERDSCCAPHTGRLWLWWAVLLLLKATGQRSGHMGGKCTAFFTRGLVYCACLGQTCELTRCFGTAPNTRHVVVCTEGGDDLPCVRVHVITSATDSFVWPHIGFFKA